MPGVSYLSGLPFLVHPGFVRALELRAHSFSPDLGSTIGPNQPGPALLVRKVLRDLGAPEARVIAARRKPRRSHA